MIRFSSQEERQQLITEAAERLLSDEQVCSCGFKLELS
jgi:hypothetical protein